MAISRDGVLYARLRATRNRLILRQKGLKGVHPTSYIHPSSRVARDLAAAEYVFVGEHCDIHPLVSIGRYTMLAPNVSIVGDDHVWSQVGVPMQFAGRPVQRTTTIGADVWVGQGVTIMRGVVLGDGALIAAGSVVTKNVPAYEVWAGTPARKLRDRFSDPEAVGRHAVMLSGPLVNPAFADPLIQVVSAR